MLGGQAGVGEGTIAVAYRRGRAERDGGRVGVRGDGLAVGGERRASVIGRACEACSSRSDSAVCGSRSVSVASRMSLGATGAGGCGWTRPASAAASCASTSTWMSGPAVAAACSASWRSWWRSAICSPMRCWWRRAWASGSAYLKGRESCSRAAAASRSVSRALAGEASGEFGQGLRAMLELTDQRQARVGELRALQRGGLRGQAVEGEAEVLLAVVVAMQLGVDLKPGQLGDVSRGPEPEAL